MIKIIKQERLGKMIYSGITPIIYDYYGTIQEGIIIGYDKLKIKSQIKNLEKDGWYEDKIERDLSGKITVTMIRKI